MDKVLVIKARLLEEVVPLTVVLLMQAYLRCRLVLPRMTAMMVLTTVKHTNRIRQCGECTKVTFGEARKRKQTKPSS